MSNHWGIEQPTKYFSSTLQQPIARQLWWWISGVQQQGLATQSPTVQTSCQELLQSSIWKCMILSDYQMFWNVMLIISSASGNWCLCSILQLSDGLCPHFIGTTEYLCGLIFMYWWCLIIDHFLYYVYTLTSDSSICIMITIVNSNGRMSTVQQPWFVSQAM